MSLLERVQSKSWTTSMKHPFIISMCLFIISFSLLTVFLYRGFLKWGDYIIGSSTFFLGFTTVYLALTGMAEGRRNRIQISELAEKDRRRLRLKEQLEGLYSPLMSYIYVLDNINEHKGEPLFSVMQKVRGKFEFLAEEELKDSLREYYNTDLWSMSEDKWEKLIGHIMEAIGTGCVDISSEYDDLTKKAT